MSIEDGSTLIANFEEYVDLGFGTTYGKYRLQLRKFYLPSSSVSLISVFQATMSGYGTKFEGDDCTIYKVGSDSIALKLEPWSAATR